MPLSPPFCSTEASFPKYYKDGTILSHPEQTELIASDIVAMLRDARSKPFYTLVAAKIRERFIRQKLSELKQGTARSPAKVFTSIVRNCAAGKLAEQKIQSISLAKQGL